MKLFLYSGTHITSRTSASCALDDHTSNQFSLVTSRLLCCVVCSQFAARSASATSSIVTEAIRLLNEAWTFLR